MEERWVKIIGWEDEYEVSNISRIKNSRTGRILRPKFSGGGYCQVALSRDTKRKFYYIHRLVGIHFIPNPLELPEVNHIDYDRANNHVDNLEWMSVKDNRANSRRAWKLTQEQAEEIRYKYIPKIYTYKMLAEEYGVSSLVIFKIVKGLTY